MDHKHRIICGLLAAAMTLSLSGCGGRDIGGDATKISTSSSAKKGQTGSGANVPEEPDPSEFGGGLNDQPQVTYAEQLGQISEQTDLFLTAVQEGDINAICDMLEPSSVYYKFFDRNRQSEQLSRILQADFGDMVWTHWTQTDMNNKNWLESAYSEQGGYTESYVCAGVKEMLFFDEFFLLNFTKGQSVDRLFKTETEEDCFGWLETTLDKMPLLKNNWALKCTLPDEEGKVLFNIDEDYIFDYTSIMVLEDVYDQDMAKTYINAITKARGVIEDENATFDSSPELRELVAQLIRDKRFEDAWQSLKGIDEDGFFDDRTEYDDLDEAGKDRVDNYVEEHAYSIVCDHSTQVYDASRRRHVFVQIYYDAIAGDDELEIEDWLSVNGIKESGEAVYFDITDDDRLASALGGYFDIISRLG